MEDATSQRGLHVATLQNANFLNLYQRCYDSVLSFDTRREVYVSLKLLQLLLVVRNLYTETIYFYAFRHMMSNRSTKVRCFPQVTSIGKCTHTGGSLKTAIFTGPTVRVHFPICST